MADNGIKAGEAVEVLVSVIMPAWNCAGTIGKAIDSVLVQDVPLELIVVNDTSPDDLDAVMKTYASDPRVRYVKNEHNLGASGSRNRGVALAKGSYVAFLDADDWWGEGKLKEQLQVLKETGYVLCSTGRELMHPDGSSTGRTIPVQEKISYADLLKHNCINCSSVLIEREAALSFPMEHDDSHEDYIMWLKVLKKYGYAVGINKPYLKCRLSEGGKSRNKLKSAAMTYKVYRYMGYGVLKSTAFFISYAVHGIWKYYH